MHPAAVRVSAKLLICEHGEPHLLVYHVRDDGTIAILALCPLDDLAL